MQIAPDASRFFDPDGTPGEPWHIVLRHSDDESKEQWYLERRLAHRDRHLGDIVVPRDRTTFTTDLTSVPQLFTWLVPRTGAHLAAALVHDALTPPFSAHTPDGTPLPDWVPPPDVITRLQADRVLRDAMADLGTPLIRRWLVWSAVSLPTAWSVNKVRALLGYVSLVAIAVLGWFATLDLFDQGWWLPWMGAMPWWLELITGGAMAVVIPLLFSVVWPRGTQRAGAITGVALAALLHVTVMVGAVTFAYQLAEFRLKVWSAPRRWLKIGLTLVAVGVVVLTWWMFHHYGS